MKDYLQKSKNGRIESFKNELYSYLRNMSEIGINKGSPSQKVLYSSDILESLFDKYKSYINNNKTIGITDLLLTIPVFINDFENKSKILNAMQEVRVIDIANWRSENIGKSLLRKRRDVLKKVG